MLGGSFATVISPSVVSLLFPCCFFPFFFLFRIYFSFQVGWNYSLDVRVDTYILKRRCHDCAWRHSLFAGEQTTNSQRKRERAVSSWQPGHFPRFAGAIKALEIGKDTLLQLAAKETLVLRPYIIRYQRIQLSYFETRQSLFLKLNIPTGDWKGEL